MDEMMKLVVGWTIVGGFVFTVIVTCLSLVGWIKFADPRQQQKLFYVLIVEVVVGLGAKFLGGVTFDPKPVKQEYERQGSNTANEQAIADYLDAGARGEIAVDKAQLERLSSRIRTKPGEPAAARHEQLRTTIQKLPEGRINPDAVKALSTSDAVKSARAVQLDRAAPVMR
jgi:hypothetical protein